MLSYETQLAFKRNVVVKAYKNYSSVFYWLLWLSHASNVHLDLPESSIPEIQPTIGSPLQYGYRTKITPHFQAPPSKIDRTGLEAQVADGTKPHWLQIGFNVQGQNKVFDIEVQQISSLHPPSTDLYLGMSHCNSCHQQGNT